jgi:hypothetical protein
MVLVHIYTYTTIEMIIGSSYELSSEVIFEPLLMYHC